MRAINQIIGDIKARAYLFFYTHFRITTILYYNSHWFGKQMWQKRCKTLLLQIKAISKKAICHCNSEAISFFDTIMKNVCRFTLRNGIFEVILNFQCISGI